MDHLQHQFLFSTGPNDVLDLKELERRRQQFQILTNPSQHSFILQPHFAFQHPFDQQHVQHRISPTIPQHLPQELHYGMSYVEAISHGLLEPEESNEPTTRPRLTKEQVDFFEREFAVNSKPPSTYKRALALQTNIEYNRVSNWFQNRRAKAKQQKKQEEFERAQRKQKEGSDEETPQATIDDDNDEGEEEDDDDDEEEEEEEEEEEGQDMEKPENVSEVKQEEEEEEEEEEGEGGKHSPASVTDRKSVPLRPDAVSPPIPIPGNVSEAAKDKGWASLQRALACARAETSAQPQLFQQQQACFSSQPLQTMPPPALPARPSIAGHESMDQIPSLSPAGTMAIEPQSQVISRSEPQLLGHDWQSQSIATTAWPSSTINASDMHFDFGFDQIEPHTLEEGIELVSPGNTSSQGAMLSTEGWDNSLMTPTMSITAQNAFSQPLPSPDLSAPSYSQSRRGSAADGLTANFENFGVATESSCMIMAPSFHMPRSNDYAVERTELAARRKRPVPALALRSHSYGAPTTKSPTFRPGMTPPSAHTLRHSKSAGHGLSSYAGVRKSSNAQKSPLSLTFEGNNLDRLMAHGNNGESAMRQPLMPASANSMTPRHTQEQLAASFQSLTQSNMQMGEMSHHRPVQSPPVTPFQGSFGLRTTSMLPHSTHAQYANYSETPPYSAGPTTASSCHWSDAGLTSPEIQHFPPVYCLPSYPYIAADEQPGVSHIYSFDQKHEVAVGSSSDKKQSEWFNHTFDGQETVYAQIAQQMGNKGPKEYTFDISNPHSFGEKNHGH